MNLTDTFGIIITFVLCSVELFGYYYLGIAGSTINSKKRRTSLLKSAIFFILTIPISLILFLSYPSQKAGISQLIAFTFLDTFLLLFIYIIIKEGSANNGKSKKANDNDPLPLILISMFMLVIFIFFIAAIAGWNIEWGNSELAT